jgi:four helix bundle suffix protein
LEAVIARHGGYRKLKSFGLARLCYDVTVRFCERYVPAGSRTRDQMVQAARSGVQNIAEGSQASATSKKTELKLFSVARASLEELLLDYEDFLRQRNLPMWPAADPRRASLVTRRCRNADEVAAWVRGIRNDALRAERDGTCSNATAPGYPEIAANAALTLIGVTCALLDRQLAALAQAFAEEGGFTERLYRVRTAQKRRKGEMD